VLPKGVETPTIVQCILGELNEEIIEEYSCDICNPKRYNAIRKTKIWKLPHNLILVIKRFTHNNEKIYTPIEPFENILELKSIYSELSPNKKNSKYLLQSIVDHHGSSNNGHYTAQAKHKKDNKWYVYDDQNIHAIDSFKIGESSYILFLEKE
jgi:ubiquitin C-terminal hydrolase